MQRLHYIPLLQRHFRDSNKLSCGPTAQELNVFKAEELLCDDIVKCMTIAFASILQVEGEKREQLKAYSTQSLKMHVELQPIACESSQDTLAGKK